MPAIPRKIDRVAVMIAAACRLPVVQVRGRKRNEKGRAISQAVETIGGQQPYNQRIFINRNSGQIEWCINERSTDRPLFSLLLSPVAAGVEVRLGAVGRKNPFRMTLLSRHKVLPPDLVKAIDFAWTAAAMMREPVTPSQKRDPAGRLV